MWLEEHNCYGCLYPKKYPPMQYDKEITGNSFSVLCYLVLVNRALQRHEKFVSVLLNDESDKLL